MDPESPNNFQVVGDDLPVEAVMQILGALRSLDKETRRRVLAAVGTLLGSEPLQLGPPSSPVQVAEKAPSPPMFSEDRTQSAKAFLIEKRPKSEVDRVACLAYYLTHYRNQAVFKTLDLSVANTDAAQPKLSNAAQAVDNATRAGILIAVGAGQKQISAAGELFVHQLPDYEAARKVLREHRQGGGRRR